MSKKIPITHKKRTLDDYSQYEIAIVDDDDYYWLKNYKWYIQLKKNGRKIVVRLPRHKGKDGKWYQKTITMAREIMKPSKGLSIIHLNHDSLDHRKSNLMMATKRQVHQHYKDSDDSIHVGVSLHQQSGKWRARIRKDGIDYHLGLFVNKQDAIDAYDHAMIYFDDDAPKQIIERTKLLSIAIDIIEARERELKGK